MLNIRLSMWNNTNEQVRNSFYDYADYFLCQRTYNKKQRTACSLDRLL